MAYDFNKIDGQDAKGTERLPKLNPGSYVVSLIGLKHTSFNGEFLVPEFKIEESSEGGNAVGTLAAVLVNLVSENKKQEPFVHKRVRQLAEALIGPSADGAMLSKLVQNPTVGAGTKFRIQATPAVDKTTGKPIISKKGVAIVDYSFRAI